MSTSSVTPNAPGPLAMLMPYLAPPVAAAGAIVLPFRDFIAKSERQQGLQARKVTLKEGLKEGLGAMRSTGTLVGAQMLAQNGVESLLLGDAKEQTLSSKLVSSAIVGAVSSPFVAIFNGKSINMLPMESLRKFSLKQGLAITLQETAFVGGLSVADLLASKLKEKGVDNKGAEYAVASTAGALGSLIGHPANTAVTRWQKGLTFSLRQSYWGALYKARAVGFFAVLYKFGKETLYSMVQKTN